MPVKLTKSVLVSAIAGALLAEALPVSAATHLEEIIVTARKREESIMKVPVVATTLGGAQIAQYGITDMTNIADKVPGLNVGGQVLASGTQVTLRGVGTSTANPAVDQSVALNVDGMQMTQGYAYRMAMFDMERIEVLKGPQALFYGKASPAGVISVRTADPGDDFDFIIRGGYEFEGKEKMTELVLSGPLNDTLGARLAAKYSDSDGYFKNTAVPASSPIAAALGDPSFGGRAPHKNYDEDEYYLVRGTVLWEPSDQFNARLKVNYAKDKRPGSGGAGQMASCPDGTSGLFLDFIGGPEDCKIDDKVRFLALDPAYFPNIKNGGQPFSNAEQTFSTLELNYDFGNDLTLTSVTGYYDIDVETMIPVAAGQFGGAYAANGDLSRDDLTQELRLTSDYEGSVNFMIGGFYHDGTTEYFSEIPFNQLVAAISPPPYNALLSFATSDNTIDTESKSVFGQILWDIRSDLELGVGVRYTDEERSSEVINSTLVHLGIAPFKVNLAEPNISSDNWAPEVSLTYTPTDELTIFGSLKEAYKSGSFDVGGLPADGEKTSFDDERVRGGELGIKSRWMDGRLAVNAAGYYYEFTDLQVERADFDAAAGRFLTHTVNAAGADVYGIDLDINYLPETVEGLTLYTAANWNIAEYDEFEANCWGGQTIADGCNQAFEPAVGLYTAQDLSGEPLLRAPEWTINYGFDYQTPVSDQMTLAIGANANYSSKYLRSPLARDDMYQESYTKISANITLKSSDDAWEVALIGDNITDELVSGNCGMADYPNGNFFGQTITGGETRGASGVWELGCQVDRGRSILLRLTLRPALLMN